MDQYYYEEGYIDAKYHVYVAEAKVEIGPYIDEGYIDPNYYLDYGVTSSLECTAQIVVGQEVIANGSFTSTTTMTTAVNKIINVSAAFTSAFTQSAIGLRDRDIDLFAFSNAAIAVQVEVTRTTNVALSTVFSIAIDASRVRYIDAAEESLFNFDAVVERSLRGFESQTQAAFSLSASANPNTKQLIAANPMIATISAIIGVRKQNSAELQSFSNLLASRYLGTGRPRRFILETENTTVNNILSTSQKKFGTHSFTYFNNGVNTVSQIRSETAIQRPTSNESWVTESWLYYQSGQTISSFNFNFAIDPTGLFYILSFLGSSNPKVELQIRKSTTTTHTGTVDLIANTWNHILTVYDNGYLQVFVNGNKNFTNAINLTSLTNANWGSTQPFIRSAVRQFAFIDDVSFFQGTNLGYNPQSASITVPSSSRTNDEYADVIWHFDGNNNDDVALTLIGNASISSISTVSGTLSGPVKLSANLTSTTTLNATISHIEGADLSAFANAALTASAINLRGFDSTPQSEFAVNIDAVKVTDVNSSISANSTLSVNNERIRDNAVATDSVATQLSAVVRLAGLFADDISVFQMSTEAVKTTNTQSNQSANFTQSADIIRVRFNQADLNSEFTETSDVFVGKVGQADIAAEFTQSTITSRTRDNIISANSTSTVECIGNNLGKIEGSLFNQASMAITAVKTVFVQSVQTSNTQLIVQTQNSVLRDYSATITSNATVSANAVKNIGTFAFLTAFASNLTVAVKDVVSDSDMAVIASMSINAVKTVNVISNLNTVIQQQISARKTVVGILSANSQFTQTATAITVLTAHADFDSISSTLAAVVKIGDFFVNADVVANANITATVIRSAQSQNSVQSQLVATAGTIKQGVTSASVISAITAQPFKVVSATATINSAMVFAAEVREIHIEEIVYVIPAEIWEYEIYPETREYAIGSETREYIIT